jgi:GH15 family glucan-1,4-alpha-glucosidase
LDGRHDEAAELFERLLGVRNELGLLAEECDPLRDARSATSRRLSPTSPS